MKLIPIVYAAYTKFEKQRMSSSANSLTDCVIDGDRAGVELTVLGKRRIQYEEELAYDGTNYDAWFSLARLEEDAYTADKEDGEAVEPTRVREVYERAVANVPPATEKRCVLKSERKLTKSDIGGGILYVWPDHNWSTEC